MDTLACGRSARGERWAFDGYDTHVSVYREGAPCISERLLLDPSHGPLAERFGRFDALATVLLLGPRVARAARALLVVCGRPRG